MITICLHCNSGQFEYVAHVSILLVFMSMYQQQLLLVENCLCIYIASLIVCTNCNGGWPCSQAHPSFLMLHAGIGMGMGLRGDEANDG